MEQVTSEKVISIIVSSLADIIDPKFIQYTRLALDLQEAKYMESAEVPDDGVVPPIANDIAVIDSIATFFESRAQAKSFVQRRAKYILKALSDVFMGEDKVAKNIKHFNDKNK